MATTEEMLADELRRAQAALAMERRINSELAESLIHYIKKENEAAGMNSIQAEIHAEARFKEVVRKLKIACFAEFEQFKNAKGQQRNCVCQGDGYCVTGCESSGAAHPEMEKNDGNA